MKKEGDRKNMAVQQRSRFIFAPWHSYVGSVGGMALTFVS